jgi:predicted acyltransferase
MLVACGYSAILLAAFFRVIELWKWQRGAQPFIWMSMNAITIYIVANVAHFQWLAERFVGGDVKVFLGDYDGFVRALLAIMFAFWLVHFLYR